MGLAETVGEVEVEGPRLREGRDFVGQQQAAALGARLGEVRRKVPAWALLVVRTLHELRMMRATGQLPGGKAWTEQAAWKVELWAVWWMGADGE
ncbi:MAG: hypothetical protein ABFE08_05970 [Armatimonadia bacterium]